MVKGHPICYGLEQFVFLTTTPKTFWQHKKSVYSHSMYYKSTQTTYIYVTSAELIWIVDWPVQKIHIAKGLPILQHFILWHPLLLLFFHLHGGFPAVLMFKPLLWSVVALPTYIALTTISKLQHNFFIFCTSVKLT